MHNSPFSPSKLKVKQSFSGLLLVSADFLPLCTLVYAVYQVVRVN